MPLWAVIRSVGAFWVTGWEYVQGQWNGLYEAYSVTVRARGPGGIYRTSVRNNDPRIAPKKIKAP